MENHTAIKMRVKGVHKSFGVDGRLVPVLEGVDVYAAAGELVSIIGPSGLLERTVDGNKAFTNEFVKDVK